MPGPAPQVVGPGPNDAEMLEDDNWYSNALNSGIEYAMGLGGYTTVRRGQQGDGDDTGAAPGDNSFYRDNADWMPGWGNTFGLDFLDPNGHPSGATAQDRATNYVGHSDPTGVWTGVRENLVTGESAAIARSRARGDSNITFTDVYDTHVDAYADAQGDARTRDPSSEAANPFIDPASFALAMYGAPLLEHAGVNTGPMTGASIDAFNDPTDSVEDGWAKRMALAGGESGVGMLLGPLGLPLVALGGYTAAANTDTAIDNGLTAGGALEGVGNVASSVGNAALDAGGDAIDAIGDWLTD